MDFTERTEEWYGVADTATDIDWLQMTPQYIGITEFIKKCQTPITIAIQGDWGIGKTSAMKNIERTLKMEGNNPCIWFKTWQFSAIKDNNNIIPEFMLTLLDKLGEIILGIKVMHMLQILLEDSEKKILPKEEIRKQLEFCLKKCEVCLIEPEKLDVILQLALDNRKEQSILVQKDFDDWKNCLEQFQKKIKEEYGIPQKTVKEFADLILDGVVTEGNALEWIRNILDMVRGSKGKIVRSFGKMAIGVAGIGAEAVIPGALGKISSEAINKIGEKAMDLFGNGMRTGDTAKSDETNPVPDNYQSSTLFLVKICNEINKIINNILKYYGRMDGRVCIFVDDLDRLKPEVALEILEGVKNFAEYESSVFILAIDKAVIDQGLRSKYDEKFLFGETEDENGRNRADKFFDKIIQVPFTLPEKNYNISEYMKNLLKLSEAHIKQLKSEKKPTSEDYAKLLQELGVYNPRSIKRCFNLQVLYDCMAKAMPGLENLESIELNKEWYRFCYFAITILQIENVEAYNALLSIILMNSNEETMSLEEIEESLIEVDEQNITTVLQRFKEAQKSIILKGTAEQENTFTAVKAKLQVEEWLKIMLTSSNYYHSFNEKQIYIHRLKELVSALKKDNVLNLDLSKLEERLEKDEKELSEHFGTSVKVIQEDYTLKVGWGKNRPRPYIIVGLNGKTIEKALNGVKFFEDYKAVDSATMDNNINYYFEGNEFTIYISPKEKQWRECLKVLKNLGYMSGK